MYYADRIESDIYGTAVLIHKRADVNGNNWWMRLKIEGVKGYKRYSTKTENAAIAMRSAEKKYETLRLRKENNLSLKSYTVEQYFNEWIEKTTKTPERKTWIKGVYIRYIQEYMGEKQLTELSNDYLKGYWQFRLNYWKDEKNAQRITYNDRRAGEHGRRKNKDEEKRRRAKSLGSANITKNPSANTLRAEGSILNEMLRDAASDGLVVRQLKLRIADATQRLDFKNELNSRRATFDNKEYTALHTNLRSYKNNTGKYKAVRMNAVHKAQREMLYAFVMLASRSGARVGELKQLRWRDIRLEKRDDKEQMEVRIRSITSKVRRERYAVTHDTNTWKILMEWKEKSDFPGDDDLIFYSAMNKKNGAQIVDLSTAFKGFLKSVDYEGREDGLYKNAEGETRTLYSLRHFYATQRLDNGASVYVVAQNMGTSVAQIQKHYGHTDTRRLAKELMKNKRDGIKTTDAVKDLVRMVEQGYVDKDVAAAALEQIAIQKS